MAVDDRIQITTRPGLLVATLDHDGAHLGPWRRFDISRAGAARLRSFVVGLPEGTIVAVAAARITGRDDLSDLWKALPRIGSQIPAESDSPQLAILGVRGAAPGTALEKHSTGRAAVRAGPGPAAAPPLQLRRIRLVNKAAAARTEARQPARRHR